MKLGTTQQTISTTPAPISTFAIAQGITALIIPLAVAGAIIARRKYRSHIHRQRLVQLERQWHLESPIR